MAESAVNVNFPAPSPYEHRVSTVGPSTGEDTTSKPFTPEEIAANERLAEQTKREQDFTATEARQKTRTAEVEKQGVELQQFQDDSLELLRNGPQAVAARDYIDMARSRIRSEQDRLDKMPAPALFADRNGWGKIRLGIGMALAGLGDGMMAAASIRAGHAPSGRSTVSEIIERDLDRQRAAISKQKDSVVMARTGLHDAQEARNVLLADIELKGKAMWRQAELLQRQRLAGLKLDQVQIDRTKEIIEAERKQREHEAAVAAAHGKNVVNRWDSSKTTVEDVNRTPSPGGDAGKIPGQQAALARQALAEFSALEGRPALDKGTLEKVQDNALEATAADTAIEGAKPVSGTIALVGRSADVIPRNSYQGLSEKDRITIQTLDRGKQLLQHVMTGAGASLGEAKQKAEAFGWVPGETEASMKAKIAGAKTLANQFIQQAPAAAPGAPIKPDAVIPPSSRTGAPSASQVAQAKRALAKGSGADDEDKEKARDILMRDRAAQRGK